MKQSLTCKKNFIGGACFVLAALISCQAMASGKKMEFYDALIIEYTWWSSPPAKHVIRLDTGDACYYNGHETLISALVEQVADSSTRADIVCQEAEPVDIDGQTYNRKLIKIKPAAL